MAVAARIVGMLANEWEICLVVIESCFVESDDVGVAAVMVRVASRAMHPACATILAMESLFVVDVAGYLIMTIEA